MLNRAKSFLFVIAIFVATVAAIFAAQSQTTSDQFLVEASEPVPAPIAAVVSTTTTTVATTTTTPPTTATTKPPAKAASSPTTKKKYPQGKVALLTPKPYPDGCIGRIMSEAEAHRCWDQLIAAFEWVHKGVRASFAKVFSVMMCESSGKSTALGPPSKEGTPTGLMQIKRGPTDPVANMRLAAKMFGERGWQPWACA